MVSGGAVLPDKGNRFRQSLQELKRTQTLVGEVSSDHHCLSSARSTPMSTPRSVSGMSVTSLGQLTPRPQPLPSTRAAAGDDIPVSVVVNIRPLVERERREGCQNCLHINLKDTVLPEVSVKGYSQRSFPFDQVYGEGAAPTADLFPECIAPLVEGLFNGFNATVLAYGQTGAGKTYTIGTHSEGKDSGRAWQAVIPQVTEMLFAKASELTEQDERSCVSFTASFFEVYQNSIRDLLAPRSKDAHIEIRERGGTDITLEGHTEMRVASPDELEHCLHRGVAARATHATNMNEHSSRSHAIFTITLNISKWRSLSTRAADFGDDSSAGSSDPGVDTGEEVEEKLSAKMHIVDLAGSERIKKSGVQGQQQKEAASINLGLLALRNCIEALCEPGRGHVPYRSNKLTRLLQDSLGGNARTVMVACVSPADSSMDETLNTLKYASSARNIKNKVVANRDEESSAVLALLDEVKMLREQLAALKAGTDGVGGDLTLLQAQRSSDTAVRIASLEEDRDSWRMRATVAESRCAELHAELQGLKNEHCASTASNGGGASPGLDLTPGQNPLFVSSGTGMGASPYTAERPLPFSAPRPASASSPNLEHSSPLQLQSAGSSEMDPLRPAEPLPASSAWRPLPDGESEGSASCRGATAGSSPKGISTRSISRNDLFEDIAFGIESPASGRWPNATEVLEMPMFQRAKMEHEQQVLTRKRDEATLLCTRLESLPGSVLRDGDGRLEPPKSKQTLDEWVNSAVVLDTQAADLKQILDAKMASRAACSHELSAIERHIQVLGRQVEEQQGEAEEVANDPAVSQRLQQLEALARELRETIGRHNSSIAQFQTFYLNLQDQIEKEGASQQAFRSRFQWVAQKDLKDVMAAVYRLTKKQREQLLDLRSDNVHLREEVAWRDTVLQLFANEIDDARTCETQLREELHRAASEKVRILDLYGVSQQEKGHLEERLVQAESGLERLHEAYTAALRELNQERSVSANLRGSLAELNDAAVQLAEEKERVLGTPGWHYDTAAAGEFPTPAKSIFILDLSF
uniref:Kinesin family member 4/7/21/27 n=1 Tax=Tetraselmis sp. GSL018 TaxID=582737 RepID=A0A061QWS8_9CHLO